VDEGRLTDAMNGVLRRAVERPEKAERIADLIRRAAGYRWVGLYEVSDEEISVLGWSGPGPPAHPRFPVGEGLCGAAVASRAAVVVGDVTGDSRYLATLSTTRSEMVAPILDVSRREVLGLIDVESQLKDAFTDADRGFLERCAARLISLWS
jgi:L-methionine (R)-S-oxide reductase